MSKTPLFKNNKSNKSEKSISYLFSHLILLPFPMIDISWVVVSFVWHWHFLLRAVVATVSLHHHVRLECYRPQLFVCGWKLYHWHMLRNRYNHHEMYHHPIQRRHQHLVLPGLQHIKHQQHVLQQKYIIVLLLVIYVYVYN